MMERLTGAATSTTLGAEPLSADAIKVGDGIVAWQVLESNQRVLRASVTPGAAPVLVRTDPVGRFEDTQCSGKVHGTTGGHIVYEQAGFTYDWTLGAGPRVLLEDVNCKALLGPDGLYHPRGDNQQVYRTRLVP